MEEDSAQVLYGIRSFLRGVNEEMLKKTHTDTEYLINFFSTVSSVTRKRPSIMLYV